MWKKFAGLILRNRIIILIVLGLITVYMGFQIPKNQISHDLTNFLPKSDTTAFEFGEFKKKYGENDNVFLITTEDTSVFTLKTYGELFDFAENLKKQAAVDSVFGITNFYYLTKNTEAKKFVLKRIFNEKPVRQSQVDSAKSTLYNLPFFEELLYLKSSNVTLLAVSFNPDSLHSRNRNKYVLNVEKQLKQFSKDSGVKFTYSGMPFIRAKLSSQVESEIFLFLFLTTVLTSLILFFFLRSIVAVAVSLLLVAVAVVWSFGFISVLGYKITLLTSLIPPLLIVISIPNCIFLLNKYFAEFKNHKNQAKALTRVITKIGNATLMTNATTAIGFATFALTPSILLIEFGVVAALSVMSVFILSILIIPIIFSFLSPPKEKHYKHLDYKWMNWFIDTCIKISVSYRGFVYMILIFLAIISGYGMSKLSTDTLIVDDIKKEDPVIKDIRYFEEKFGGVIPFEILIDTKKKGKATKLNTIKKVEKLYEELKRFKEFSKPMSILDITKYSKQAFYNGEVSEYSMPLNNEMGFIYDYAKRSSGSSSNLMKSFVNDDKSELRISLRMEDVGTVKMQAIIEDLKIVVNDIFPTENYKVTYTGVSVVTVKGVDLLISNLIGTLLLAILLIAILMAFMFRNARMVFISIVPNLIPLIFTAAIMGYFGINVKPTTILVFSIAFGISVDDTIHFLAKYRQELLLNDMKIKISVIKSLKETGLSMFSTSIILFFGFGIFILSDFGGTQALGMLVAITLLIAMLSNLILLPTLLLTLDNFIKVKKGETDFFDEANEEDVKKIQ